MPTPSPRFLIATLCLAGASVLTAAEPVRDRVVAADAHVRSAKRGVCLNRVAEADFRVMAPGVSWFYNWYHACDFLPPAELEMEFLPMVWGNGAERLAGLESWLAAGHKPRVILAINEPNLRGQAFITPAECAELFQRTVAIADRFDIPVVGPHIALGSAPNESITAHDPLEKKSVTYTWFMPYLKAWAHHLAGPVPALGVHSYGNIHELRWSVEATWKAFGKPIWVTEFAQWDAPSDAAELDYLIQAVDYLERSPHVAGYAWFKERSNHARISLLAKEAGELTPLGEAYVSMPTIDPNLRYQVPGRIQAEVATVLSHFDVRSTTDADGIAELRATNANATATIRLHAERAARWRLGVRTSSSESAVITVTVNGKRLGDLRSNGSGWSTATTELALPKGAVDLLLTTAKGVTINWVEITAP